MNTAPIVSRVWSFCTTLRDDGVSYGDYLEQLTYLIFLKMADEYGRPPYSRDVGIPAALDWQSLKTKRGAELEGHYVTLLRELGTRRGMLGQIFTKAQNKIQDPAKLYRLIDMVDETDWVTLGADVKGDIYEGLLFPFLSPSIPSPWIQWDSYGITVTHHRCASSLTGGRARNFG